MPFGIPSQGVDVVLTGSWTIRNAGGNRTHFNCFAGSRLAIWLQRLSKAESRKRKADCAERDNASHVETSAFGIPLSAFVSTPPGSRTSSDSFEDYHASITPAGREEAVSFQRSAFSKLQKSRRLGLHQHEPVYETGVFLFRVMSAVSDQLSAVRVQPKKLIADCYVCNSTFQ